DGAGMITRDWAGYMMSATILVGAEVDKLLSIGVVTAVLAVAVSRARRLMIAAAAERHAAEGLSRFFAPEVAGQIRETDLDLETPGTRREAAVLIVDLRGFSEISTRLSPVQTIELLSEYHARIVPVIHGHGGAIDKYLGDGILATFGALRPSDSRAADALAALCGVLREGAAWRASREGAPVQAPEVNAALDVGTVTVGIVGHESRLEFTIIGDVVNRVAKLEKHTRTLDAPAVVSTAVLEQAGGAVDLGGLSFHHHDGEAVPGLAEPMDLVAIRPDG
ncbi:MAG TPA: adenylate/guanylate cyclase domain-containing protein, partial [Thermohalobaculum sp.]|nr:adenylate/guanylate cyclase domain-containing protein [Thermohalobaculum sp.]